MLKVPMLCPERDDELTLAQRMLGEDAPEAVLAGDAVEAVISPGELSELRGELQGVTVRDELLGYIVDIVRQSREHGSILVGAGPRATQGLLIASRAYAAVSGRDFVTPDDIKDMAVPVLVHRLILRPEFEIEGLTVEEVIGEILEAVAVPR